MLSVLLRCRSCSWQTVCGAEQVERRLRQLGLLRRAAQPPDELVRELLTANLHRLTCDQCGAAGLTVGTTDDADDADDWQQAALCDVCQAPIPPERLEVYPDAKRCVACQDAAERGVETAEPEFCPRCGALLELRVSRGGGITRYKQFCTGDPPCRL